MNSSQSSYRVAIADDDRFPDIIAGVKADMKNQGRHSATLFEEAIVFDTEDIRRYKRAGWKLDSIIPVMGRAHDLAPKVAMMTKARRIRA